MKKHPQLRGKFSKHWIFRVLVISDILTRFCFLIFDVNQLLFSSSLSHIPFKLVVQIPLSSIGWTGILLGKKYAFELKSQSRSLLNYRLYVPRRQRPKPSATLVCCHHILNLHLFLFLPATLLKRCYSLLKGINYHYSVWRNCPL